MRHPLQEEDDNHELCSIDERLANTSNGKNIRYHPSASRQSSESELFNQPDLSVNVSTKRFPLSSPISSSAPSKPSIITEPRRIATWTSNTIASPSSPSRIRHSLEGSGLRGGSESVFLRHDDNVIQRKSEDVGVGNGRRSMSIGRRFSDNITVPVSSSSSPSPKVCWDKESLRVHVVKPNDTLEGISISYRCNSSPTPTSPVPIPISKSRSQSSTPSRTSATTVNDILQRVDEDISIVKESLASLASGMAMEIPPRRTTQPRSSSSSGLFSSPSSSPTVDYATYISSSPSRGCRYPPVYPPQYQRAVGNEVKELEEADIASMSIGNLSREWEVGKRGGDTDGGSGVGSTLVEGYVWGTDE
ncbi:hypothetical protein HDU76_002622 [Blyttiomyces sp. JEL0837]|nr:hypothetical protein HDU76_002622 [Blyttiomyces sp. JEL0837]